MQPTVLPVAGNRRRLLSSVALIMLMAGCGGRGTYPVRGTVAFQGEQAPAKELAGYLITLVSSGENGPQVSATGVVQDDGTFRLSTFSPDDGAVPGKHQVAITPPPVTSDTPMPPSLIDVRYWNPDTSGLEVTVQRGKDVTLTVPRLSP